MQIRQTGQLKGVTVRAPNDNRMATAATMKRMSAIVKRESSKPFVINLARQIVVRVPAKNFPAEAAAVQEWVRQNIRYTRDPYFSETLQTPEVTVTQGHGDCDDHAILAASLISALGGAVRFRAIRIPGNGPNLAHVLTETRIGRGWVPVETTEPWPFGQYPDSIDLRDSMVRHL